MTDNFNNIKHVMPADRDHAGSCLRRLELEPVGGEPQIPDGLAEHLDGYAATTESRARATAGMVYKADPAVLTLHATYAAGFNARVAYDRRCYLVGSLAIVFGLALMIGALLWLGPGWLRATPAHIALDDTAWCSSFRGLSCKQQDTARE